MPVHHPDIVYDRPRVVTLADRTAAEIMSSGHRYHGIVANANGGLIPAALICQRTGLPLLDIVQMRRYPDDAKKSLTMPVVLRHPRRERVDGKWVIGADDVLDEGYSAVRFKHLLTECGAFLVHLAMLDYKLGPRAKHFQHLKPEFIGETHQGAPWIEYPWEREGVTREDELMMFVADGHLDRSLADQFLAMLREPLETVAV